MTTLPINPLSQHVKNVSVPMAKAISVGTLTPYYAPDVHPLTQNGFNKASYIGLKSLLNLAPLMVGAMAIPHLAHSLGPIAAPRLGLMGGLGITAIKEWVELVANPSQRQQLGQYLFDSGYIKPGSKIFGFIPIKRDHVLTQDNQAMKSLYIGGKAFTYAIPAAIALKLAMPLGMLAAVPLGLLSGLGTNGLREFMYIGWNKNQRRLVGHLLLDSNK